MRSNWATQRRFRPRSRPCWHACGSASQTLEIEGALVTQMAPPGHELIVGMRRDPQFGPLLMFGLGGIYVELLKDVAFRVAPFDRAETLAMIGETHAGKLLAGLRGQPPADIDAVAEVIERVARLALDHPGIPGNRRQPATRLSSEPARRGGLPGRAGRTGGGCAYGGGMSTPGA